MDLAGINKKAFFTDKPVKKLKDLTIQKPHLILDATLTTTAFGEAILLELADHKVFLPTRVTERFKDNLNRFQPEKYTIKFTGLRNFGKRNPAVEFLIEEVNATVSISFL